MRPFDSGCRPIGVALSCAGVLGLASCGGSSGGGGTSSATTAASTASKTVRAGGLSLQAAMDASARAIDGVRGTRDSLERLGASLQPTIAQTGDVIVLLTPAAADGDANTASQLLSAARQQRSFLQFAKDATDARANGAANNAINRARQAGVRATSAYARITQQEESGLAGLVPSATTFNTGRLRDAVRNANKRTTTKPKTKSPSSAAAPSAAPSRSGSCGDGISVNSVTSCTFAANVRDAYRSSGGSSVIEVFSPVTQTNYTMSCSGSGPTTCSGGNGAVVTFR